jgi:peptidoglycan hydrolase CwlO-like protein
MYKHLGSKQRKVWTIAMLILVIVPMTWSVPGLHQLNAMEDDAEVESNKSAKEIATKEQEILALNARIEELKKQKSTATIDAAIIAEQLNKIKREVERAQLELNRTKGAINKIAEESVTTEDEIAIIKEKLVETRLRLRHIIRTLYIREQESLITVWLVSGSLGDLLSARSALQELQNQSVILVGDLREQQIILEQKQRT